MSVVTISNIVSNIHIYNLIRVGYQQWRIVINQAVGIKYCTGSPFRQLINHNILYIVMHPNPLDGLWFTLIMISANKQDKPSILNVQVVKHMANHRFAKNVNKRLRCLKTSLYKPASGTSHRYYNINHKSIEAKKILYLILFC